MSAGIRWSAIECWRRRSPTRSRRACCVTSIQNWKLIYSRRWTRGAQPRVITGKSQPCANFTGGRVIRNMARFMHSCLLKGGQHENIAYLPGVGLRRNGVHDLARREAAGGGFGKPLQLQTETAAGPL